MADYPSNQALAMLIEQEGVTGLAAVCGVTEGTVRNWRKKGRVTGAAARLLYARTGTSWRELVGMDGEREKVAQRPTQAAQEDESEA